MRATALVAACALAIGACTSDSTTTPTVATTGPAVVAGQPFPEQRCADNKAAGTITFVSGYDFAAAASIVDVLVAKQKGYFDALCLDVSIEAGLSSDNYPLVDQNSAQFASSGSFSEMAMYASTHVPSTLRALAVEGKVANDALIVKQGAATTLTDLTGATIGVKGALPASIRAMLAKAGLSEGNDYHTQAIDGFDPIAHIALPGVVGFTGFTSNEPGQLDRAGLAYTEFDPSSDGIPGSFGVIYSNTTFMSAHPTAAVDFMRATMHGLADAVADPAAASMIAVDFIDNNGNPKGLDPDGEAFRWQTESKLVVSSTPAGTPLGLPDGKALTAEVDAYAAVGMFGGTAPDTSAMYDASVLAMIYDSSDRVISPG